MVRGFQKYRFSSILILSEAGHNEKIALQLGCKKKIHVIPPQIRIPKNINVQKVSNTICFIGSFNREPNIHAVESLISDIYPKITLPAELNIVGKGLPIELQKQINDIDRINYLGFINNIDEFLISQMLLVAPIQIGSGLKMKITHALACGTAVITTPIGAEGISINSENGLWICNSTQSMADKINKVLCQDEMLIEKGIAGKMAVTSLFSENTIIPKFETLYKQLIDE